MHRVSRKIARTLSLCFHPSIMAPLMHPRTSSSLPIYADQSRALPKPLERLFPVTPAGWLYAKSKDVYRLGNAFLAEQIAINPSKIPRMKIPRASTCENSRVPR